MTFPLYNTIVSELSILAGKRYFWWAVLSVIIAPLLVLVFFNHPSADDYCYAVSAHNMGLWKAQTHSYETWSGRYTATFLLCASPVIWGSFAGYKVITFILLVLTVISCFYFVKTIMNKQTTDISVIAVSACILFLYIFKMPTLTEGFYWMAGAITYQLGNIAVLAVVTILLNLKKKYHAWQVGLAAGLSFFICGCNETSMLEFIYILCAMMAFEYASTQSIPRYYYILLAVSMIGAAIIIAAPGNAVRSSFYQGEKNIVKALYLAGTIGFVKMQEWLQNILILIVLFLPFLKRTELFTSDSRKITPVVLILYPLFILGILILGYFPAFWSMGAEPPARTSNVLYWIFCFACFHYTVLWIIYIRQKNAVFVEVPKFVLFILAFLAFRDLAPQNNWRTATMDLVSGRAVVYDREMEERYAIIKKSTKEDLVFNALSAKPKSVFFTDVEAGHPEDWKNVCTSDYFHLKSLDLAKTVE